jgi:poly-gamma-glutamate synthesis protein (capsule biosynthesis protein)
MIDLAQVAIDSGADVVMGHGPHFPLGIETYKEKPVFYGLGSFSFHTGHRAVHGDWVGLMLRITLEDSEVVKVAFSPVRHNERNETILHTVQEERESMEHLASLCQRFGTTLDLSSDEVVVWQQG